MLKATERSFLYLYDKIWGDSLHYRLPLQILRGLVPPVIYTQKIQYRTSRDYLRVTGLHGWQ